jgi:hypothetical protein
MMMTRGGRTAEVRCEKCDELFGKMHEPLLSGFRFVVETHCCLSRVTFGNRFKVAERPEVDSRSIKVNADRRQAEAPQQTEGTEKEELMSKPNQSRS